MEEINIIQQIFDLKEDNHKFYLFNRKELITKKHNKYMTLYSSVKENTNTCFKRFVLEEIILGLDFINCVEDAYKVFLDLYRLNEEWKTREDKTLDMNLYFGQYLETEYKEKIFNYGDEYLELKDHITNEDDVIKEYINECNKIIDIGESVEDNGLYSLWELYFGFYRDPIKALKYAKRMNLPSIHIELCEKKILKIEKNKHFKQW